MSKRTLKISVTTVILLFICGLANVALFNRVARAGGAQKFSLGSLFAASGPDVGLWKRFEVTIPDSSWSGNPFDVELTGVFTHASSGKTVAQLGFYAGGNTWKIYFMPDQLGEWNYVTQSPDPDLNGQTGSLNAVPSGLPGQLVGAGNRWKLSSSGDYIAPIMLPTRQWFKSTPTGVGVDDFILWAKNTSGAHIIGTTLVYFQQEQAAIPYMIGQEGQTFNIAMWDRMNSHYDYLRDQGMGFYIMFYTDDAEAPNKNGIGEMSAEEIRLFRYAVARFSAYPIVLWDTGIDIGETRSTSWVNWFTDWFNTYDPWGHPVSSRTGGGSGGIFPTGAGYYSDGTGALPSHQQVVDAWSSRNVPTAYTDRWREDYTRGNFDEHKIRRAVWEVGLVGGTTAYVGGNENKGYLTENYAADFKAAPYVGYRTQFFQQNVLDFGALTPRDDLLVNGDKTIVAADAGTEYVVYDWDGGSFTLDLSDTSGTVYMEWLDPKTNQFYNQSTASVAAIQQFTPPFGGDSVLHLINLDGGAPSPTPAASATPAASPTPEPSPTPGLSPTATVPLPTPTSPPPATSTPEPTNVPPTPTSPGPTSTAPRPTNQPPTPTSPGPTATSPPPGDETLHVADIDAQPRIRRETWATRITVRILDSEGNQIEHAEVEIEALLSNGFTGTATCETNDKGDCRFAIDSIPFTETWVEVMVVDVVLEPYTYDPDGNEDPDEDSDGTTMLVLMP